MNQPPKLADKVRCLDGMEGTIIDIRGDVVSVQYRVKFKRRRMWGKAPVPLWMPQDHFTVI